MPLFDYEDEIIEEYVEPAGYQKPRRRSLWSSIKSFFRLLRKIITWILIIGIIAMLLPIMYGFASALLADYGIELSPEIGRLTTVPADTIIEIIKVLFGWT